jgi:diguanylate cyclase
MLFTGKANSRSAYVSDAVYMEVIATLYGTVVPILFAAIGQAIVGAVVARQTGDIFTAVLTALGVFVAFVRLLGVVSYRRRVAGNIPLDRKEAVAWEWRYAIGSGIVALILGLFAARILILGDAICLVMAIGMAFGFGAGVVARLSLRPIVAVVDLCAIGLPVIGVSLLQELDAPHVGLTLLMMIYLACSFEMVRLTYSATLNQMTLKQQFEQLARTDPMTGLLNRSVLATELAQIVAERGRASVAIHAIDLDHFKAANDRFGHPVGDALLKQVAARLQSLAGPSDIIIRMGGDEFTLVQRSVGSRDAAAAMAQRIFEQVSAPYCVDGHDIVVGASIGIAMTPDDGQSVEALLSRSDHALYRAKAQRGGYVFSGDPVSTAGLANEKPIGQRAA